MTARPACTPARCRCLFTHETTIPCSIVERFWAKVDRRGPDQCWPWTAGGEASGYGRFGWSGKEVIRSHTALMRILGIVVPPLHEPDHLCFNRSCCNPRHFEVVTGAENRRRGVARRMERVGYTTECAHGHPMRGPNLAIDSEGRRRCVKCRRTQGAVRARRYQAKKRAASLVSK